jgi:ABC-type lipoprotein export system ATPase subunit
MKMIELENVKRTYTKGSNRIHALDDVTLRIARGEFVAVTGPSGSGKSTLMNIVGLLDRAEAGSYRLDGADVGTLTADELAALRNERIGFVFQMFHLLPKTTAVANVELPLVYARGRPPRGTGLEALERVGLADRATHMPHELSGGQQQRVAIARALVQNPDVLLADEPTGNLDAEAGREVLDLFRSLNEAGTTVVVVTHDESVSRHASRRIDIASGRIRSDTAD